MSKPKITENRTIAQTKLFTIEAINIEFANGNRRDYERLIGGSPEQAVMVVPLLDDDTVLMIKEYSAGLDNYQITLPKGAVDIGESVLEGANRELMEEAGYGSKQLQILKVVSLSPSYMSHCMTIVLARDLYPKRLEGDEPEPLEVIPYSLSALDDWVVQENVTEARAIAALYMTKSLIHKESTQ